MDLNHLFVLSVERKGRRFVYQDGDGALESMCNPELVVDVRITASQIGYHHRCLDERLHNLRAYLPGRRVPIGSADL